LASVFQIGLPNYAGVTVTEATALGSSPVWRAVSLIAQTIASLKVGAVDHGPDGTRERVATWVDEPSPTLGLTAFEFWELVVVHLLLHGNAFLLHVRDGAGRMVGLIPIHPGLVTVEWDAATLVKTYKVTGDDGHLVEYTDLELTHVMGTSTNGLYGMSVITVARQSLGITIAGDRATASNFNTGAAIAGFITPDEDMDPDEAEEAAREIRTNVTGFENAGRVPILNRKLKFNPMAMTLADAQFIESRKFQVEEVARWFGVPPHMLMQTEKQTSWGTGVAEQNRGLSRTVLGPLARRIEDRVSRLFGAGRYLEFDFAALERPTPEQEIDLLLKQVAGGLMTVNEARAIRNMPPAPDGDILYQPAGSVGSTDETPEGADPGQEVPA
jgi:HK97 family phage portal protein